MFWQLSYEICNFYRVLKENRIYFYGKIPHFACFLPCFIGEPYIFLREIPHFSCVYRVLFPQNSPPNGPIV